MCSAAIWPGEPWAASDRYARALAGGAGTLEATVGAIRTSFRNGNGHEYIHTVTHGVRQKGMVSAAYFTNFLATGIRF